METLNSSLKPLLDKLRKKELEELARQRLLEKNKAAAREVLLSLSLILDRQIPTRSDK
jgi:hypothetical protein